MECPNMSHFLRYEKLDAKHRDLFNRYIRAYPLRNSEITFNSIYIWRDNWPLWLSEENGILFLKRKYEHRLPCFWPPLASEGRIAEALCIMLEEAERDGWPFELRGVNEEYKQRMELALPGVFTFVYDRNFSDYVYKADDLRELRGKKLHAKRNHVNRFIDDHPDYVFRRAQTGDLARCEEILTESIVAADQAERVDEEILLLRRTFAVADEGFMDIAVLEAGGLVQGYTAGERQFDDTALIHLEVANREISGAYAIINRDFLRDFYPDVTWANREEDVGQEGLRKAKMSYHPDHMINKYTVYRKNGAPIDGE